MKFLEIQAGDALANTLFIVGRHIDAATISAHIVGLASSQLGPQDTITLGIKKNYARTLIALYRREEALELLDDVLRIESTLLGPDHPTTQMTSTLRWTASFDPRNIAPKNPPSIPSHFTKGLAPKGGFPRFT